MTLLLRKRFYRQIQHQPVCSHRAISRANQALRSLGLTRGEQVAALTNDELDEIYVDRRSSGRGEFVPIGFDLVVKVCTVRTKHARLHLSFNEGNRCWPLQSSVSEHSHAL